MEAVDGIHRYKYRTNYFIKSQDKVKYNIKCKKENIKYAKTKHNFFSPDFFYGKELTERKGIFKIIEDKD